MTLCRMLGYIAHEDWFGLAVDGTHDPKITMELEQMKRFILFNFTCAENWGVFKIEHCTWDKKVAFDCPARDGINWQLLVIVCRDRPGL